MLPSKQKSPLSRYTDPTGELSNRQLAFGAWYVNHKERMRAIFIGTLFACDAALMLFSLWGWGSYFLFGMEKDRTLAEMQIKNAPDYARVHPKIEARSIQFKTPAIYRSGPDRYDAVIDAVNPNDRWVAQVSYRFRFSNGETGLEETVLLPQEARPIASFGYQASGFPSGGQIVIEHVAWRKLNPHAIPNIEEYIADRKNFTFDSFSFIGATAEVPTHRILFTIANNTIYSYWMPGFYVELLDGDLRKGLLFVSLPQFRAGETQSVDIRSFADNLFVDNIRLHPLVNVFDAGEFMRE